MTTAESQIKYVRDLDEIVDLSIQLLTQAVNDANATVDGTSLPGGRAMVALAHAGDTATFERRVDLVDAAWVAAAPTGFSEEHGVLIRAEEERPDPAIDEDDDRAPALQTLRYWSEQYRWELGAVWDHIPTINTEAKFLRNPDVIAHVIEHHGTDWDHLARDVNRARRHLESILYAGKRPDRTRVVCNNPGCSKPKELILVHGRRYEVGYTCRVCATAIPTAYECDTCHRTTAPTSQKTCGRRHAPHNYCEGTLQPSVDLDHCPNPWCFTVTPPEPIWASDADDDRWKCTTCKTHYDTDRLRKAHADQLRHESADRYVQLPEAIATLKVQGRAERTIRKWLEPPLRHEDKCTRCRKCWPEREHAACPRKLLDKDTKQPTGEECGGDLVRVTKGNAEAVLDSWCHLATRKVWVWWPDLWTLHNATKTRSRKTA